MMTVVGYLEERRFFEQVIEAALVRLRPNAWQFCVLIMLLGGISAALVDGVTSILFMTALTLHFVTARGVNPIPFVIMPIFATNIGSGATVVGNPVGVMVTLQGRLIFVDFLRWAFPIAVVGMVMTITLALWYFRKSIRELQKHLQEKAPAIKDSNRSGEVGLLSSVLIFGGLIGGLILHSPVGLLLGLPKKTMLLGTVCAISDQS